MEKTLIGQMKRKMKFKMMKGGGFLTPLAVGIG